MRCQIRAALAMMNTFNRIFTVAGLIALLVLGAATLVTPAGMLSLLQSLADAARTQLFAGFSDTSRFVARIVLAIAWVLLITLVLWMELRRPSTATVEVMRYTGGNTIRIRTTDVAERLHEAIVQVADVLDAKVRVIGRNRAVEVKVDVAAARHTDLIAKAEEIATLTRRVIQEEMGLKLAEKPQVSIRTQDGRGATAPIKPIAPISPMQPIAAPTGEPTPTSASAEPPAASTTASVMSPATTLEPPPAPSSREADADQPSKASEEASRTTLNAS
ncbi:MAG: hypothetical protein RMJ86_02835 [Anaerolineae bacterium]|nr:hypothetical protein [Thermoflexales bacterium]MDW8053468.1 hypothetical protein [Anaerolineae bacterium]MDW8293214.1 hypothetical protein [Anaerolineae bacterium]